jgi:large subunit ribosomal protein L13
MCSVGFLIMDMNKSFRLHKENSAPSWRVIDAEGQVLGRLATYVADALRGKDKAFYTPHTDSGDYIVIINAEKIVLTGNKLEGKIYDRYSGWMGGYKVTSAKDMLAKKPEFLLEHAVKGMLPKNKLSDQIIKKLKVYAGSEHPHKAQVSK